MTSESDQPAAGVEALKRQAIDWHARLASGEVTAADADALRRWCGESDAHARAFAEAHVMWQALGPAARNVAERARARQQAPMLRAAGLRRRTVLGGTAAAAAAAAGWLGTRPPLGLWPSVSELMAQYRTATGERRQLTIAGGTAVEMNTQTSLNVAAAAGGIDQIELISGEAVIATADVASNSVLVLAADGRMTASQARFDVRCDRISTCVTCLDGTVTVEHRGRSTVVRAREQVSYGDGGLDPVAAVDPAVVTSWRAGVLVFRRELLSRAVEEINRYRHGRIIIVDAALGNRRIDASFRLDQIGDVVPQIEHVFGVSARHLPGGIVLLG
jgi:transmembrane sensor